LRRSAQFTSSFGHECACSRCDAERLQLVASKEAVNPGLSAELQWTSFSKSFSSAFASDSANIESFGLEQAGLRLHSNIEASKDMFPAGSWQEMRMLEWYRKVIQLNSKQLPECPKEFLTVSILHIQCLYQNRIARLGAVATAFLTATRITFLVLLRLLMKKGIIGIVPHGGTLGDMKAMVQVLVSLNEAGAHSQQ